MGALVVDWGARTITGPAVPYDRFAYVSGRHYRFLPHWAHYGAVPLLYEHDSAMRVGKGVAFTDTPAALCVVLKVRRGPFGDRMLSRTEAGTLGLSPKFVPDAGGLHHYPARPGALLVASALLVELTLTRNPAFGLE